MARHGRFKFFSCAGCLLPVCWFKSSDCKIIRKSESPGSERPGILLDVGYPLSVGLLSNCQIIVSKLNDLCLET